jgi:hypothetical protein
MPITDARISSPTTGVFASAFGPEYTSGGIGAFRVGGKLLVDVSIPTSSVGLTVVPIAEATEAAAAAATIRSCGRVDIFFANIKGPTIAQMGSSSVEAAPTPAMGTVAATSALLELAAAAGRAPVLPPKDAAVGWS